MASSMAPGGGGRFQKLQRRLQQQGKTAEQAAKIAAVIGMKKYGKKQMLEWARRGRRKKK